MKAAIFDVDGVLTDGRIYIGEHGETVKAFSTLDGHGLKLLRQGGIEPLVITGRDSPAVRRRIADLGLVHAAYGAADKLAAAEALLAALGLDWPEVAAIGDDWPDLPLLQRAGFACAPANAHAEVKAVVHHVTVATGGHGAAREFCDLLLVAAGRYAGLLAGARDDAGRRLSAMSVELHLPDLPEVPIALGPARGGAAPRQRLRWHLRWRDRLAAYLPLLLMTLLALFTWWLVKNSPVPAGEAEAPAVRHEPDYTMTQFALERFDAAGRLKLRIEGATLRHFPDTDRVEVDDVRIRSIAPDGRVTRASARRAVSNGDASELQLIGGARVTSENTSGGTLEMDGEFLQANLVAERVHSPLPVHVQVDGADMHAAGLDYDHGSRRLELTGPMRAVFDPPAKSR